MFANARKTLLSSGFGHAVPESLVGVGSLPYAYRSVTKTRSWDIVNIGSGLSIGGWVMGLPLRLNISGV